MTCANTFGQKYPFYRNHKWESEPVWNEENKDEHLYYYTKYLFAVEYEFDSYTGGFYKYETMHYRVKLSTDASIDEFNKIYISMEDVHSLKIVKGRVIKKDKVVDFKPDVEEMFSEDEEDQYYYFPVQGLELGDELEIIYTKKMDPSVNGDQYPFQGDIPIYDFDFFFVCPNDTYFQFLSHNGLPDAELEDTIRHKNQWRIHLDSIEAFRSEYFCEYYNEAMKLDVSLRGFDSPSDKSFSPYDAIVEWVNYIYNSEVKGKDLKYVRRLSEELGISRMNKKADNIRKIEHYMKTDFVITNSVGDQSLADLIKLGKANTVGTIQLYMALFKEADVQFEYGFISDRYETAFSKDIESMEFLQSYFFYFPEIDNYMAPLDFSSRLGYVDFRWVPNHALFLESKLYPFPKTKKKVKEVPATKAEENIDSTIVYITVSQNLIDLEMTVERYLKGHQAGDFQSYYYLYNEGRRETEEEDLLDIMNDGSKYKTLAIDGVESDDAYVKTLYIKGKVTEMYAPLLEQADDKIIFKLGNIFGEYVDVREIEKKKKDFVFGYSQISSTTVFVTFPTCVKVSNTETIPVGEDFVKHKDIVFGSEFKVDGSSVMYKFRRAYYSHRFRIEDKEEVLDAFTFYNQLNKMNLLIECE